MDDKSKARLRIMTGVTALIMASAPISLNTKDAHAEGINNSSVTTVQKYKNGTFIDELMEYEESQYRRYVVAKGDNISLISKKICRYYEQEPTTKYWPVLAFLNQFPRVIQPGDILIFPGTFEDMDGLWSDLKETGWIDRYVAKNKVYSKSKSSKSKGTTVGDLIAEIYGSEYKNPEFVQRYLKIQGLDSKYSIDSVISGNNDALFELTDWIPTLEEINNNGQSKIKRKNK